MTPTSIVGYLALFFSVGFLFLFVNLLVGRFLRPKLPNVEKLEVYECGEPAIGSSFIQFDLRFYVIALLFIIFDVEVALFFPWATVFGKSTHLMDPNLSDGHRERNRRHDHTDAQGRRDLQASWACLIRPCRLPERQRARRTRRQCVRSARVLALISIVDIVAFFAVLMVGFAYVWRRGDLDWVRALSLERAKAPSRPISPLEEEEEPALVG